MKSKVRQLAEKINMPFDEFIGEMRKRGCSQPTAVKIWNSVFDEFDEFKDNDIFLSNIREAADVLQVAAGTLLSK
jgi:hypothetical protein